MKQYLMYLRKSRKDRDLELQTGSFDTLQRHRDTLLALAKQRGYSIAHIYEEGVSGDSIADRPEMQKLLAAVETGAFEGVLVMEVPRLARGNTKDQGVVAETFQYSGTKIVTPEKIYDPADEADEEYFEFGLFMSRREYKAINRRLQRGRLASLAEGKYIAGTPPYGYRKVKPPIRKATPWSPRRKPPAWSGRSSSSTPSETRSPTAGASLWGATPSRTCSTPGASSPPAASSGPPPPCGTC